MASVAAVALALHASGAWSGAQTTSDAPSQSSSSRGQATLDTVTVEAKRKKKEIERQVSHFVFSVPIHYLDDSLSRWKEPICPLVAGLPRDQGEFILARLSQIVTSARAPLAGVHCKANFYVVVTREPDELLKKWHARDPHMYITRNGMGHIRSFLHIARAIRVWYNTDFSSTGGTQISDDSLALGMLGTGLEMRDIPTNTVESATRLNRSAVQSMSSVIVIVDANRIKNLNFGQLTDYIAMVGLGEINLDADVNFVPTILNLFRNTRSPPQGLSDWDQAFLYSLYNADQESVAQEGMMARLMLDKIAP